MKKTFAEIVPGDRIYRDIIHPEGYPVTSIFTTPFGARSIRFSTGGIYDREENVQIGQASLGKSEYHSRTGRDAWYFTTREAMVRHQIDNYRKHIKAHEREITYLQGVIAQYQDAIDNLKSTMKDEG